MLPGFLSRGVRAGRGFADPLAVTRKFQYILGIKFFTGDLEGLLGLCAEGNFIVVPAAPKLVDLAADAAYREAVEKSDFAITDSGFMVLLWNILAGPRLSRISGLKLLRALLDGSALKEEGASFWIMPSPAELETNLAWLNRHGCPVRREECAVAPLYDPGPLADPDMLQRIEARKPRYVVINIGGGAQERLGYYLRTHLSYRPTILCTGAAIAFLAGAQATIPPWADAFMLGWFFRCLQAPARFIPRYVKALQLVFILAHHREQSVAGYAGTMMDVTLLGNYPHDGQESMTRYAEMLKDILSGAGCRVEIVRPEPLFGRLKPSSQGVGKWLGYLDKFVLFPFALRRHVRRRRHEMEKRGERGAFLVHICDHSNAMYTRWLRDVPHLVTCHDVLAIQSGLGLIPQQHTRWTGRRLQSWILSGLRRAPGVVCVSEATQNDLLSLAPELKDRTWMVGNVLNYPYAPLPPVEARRNLAGLGLDEALPPEGRFLLHVGGNQWYKNREGVLRIFAHVCASVPDARGTPPLKLVMAGKPPTDAMGELVEKEGLAGRVIFVPAVSNPQLCALYSSAAGLIFPSLREGFGWPVLEAQACGCPVVTSHRPPMSQVGGPAAFLADPENEAEFAVRIVELLSEDKEAGQRREIQLRRHAETYRSEVFCREILASYHRILKQEGGSS